MAGVKINRGRRADKICRENRRAIRVVTHAAVGEAEPDETARWRLPADARIRIVTDSQVVSAKDVRAQFRHVKPLAEIKPKERGWTLDVLNAVRHLGKTQFTTAEMYSFTRELEQLHPDNRHVKDKIRQQLQVLRDRGLLRQVERGVWSVK